MYKLDDHVACAVAGITGVAAASEQTRTSKAITSTSPVNFQLIHQQPAELGILARE